jgi:hypothetical protein
MSDFRPSPAAGEMAEALRSGVAVRRQQAQDALGADAARLTALGDIEGLAPPAKPGAAAPVVRFARRVLQAFMRPWLAMQTIFNREISRRFDEHATIVRDLRRRVPLIEDSLQSLDARVRALEPHGAGAADGARARTDAGQLHRLFIHSRLPPPPATVVIGAGLDADFERELAGLGYQLGRSGQPSDAVAAALDARAGTLADSLVESAFDAAQGARGGGRLVLVVQVSGDDGAIAGHIGGIAAARAWRIAESLVCVDSGWSTASAAPVSVLGLTLVRVQPDASDR